jgi:hypothetical protein
MDAFRYIAEKSIRTSSDGSRCLFLFGPFARPYAVSSPDTEERIVQKLASAFRALSMPVLALIALLCRWPSERTLIAGLAVLAIAGWLVVRAALSREIRRLKRIDPTMDARSKRGEWLRQLEPLEWAEVRRRRAFLLAGFSFACAIWVGCWLTRDAEPLAYIGALFGGLASVVWGRLAMLPPAAILVKRRAWFSMLAPDGDLPKVPESLDSKRSTCKTANVQPGVWDWELDCG